MNSKKIEEAEMMNKLGIDAAGSRWRKWKWIIFAALLIILAISIGIAKNRGDSAGEVQHFKTKEVAEGSLTVTVNATGTLKPTNQVDVGSELSGKVSTVDVQYNDHVKKGQVLATIDGSTYEAMVNQSKASLESAQAQVLNAQATEKEAQSKLDRLKEVWQLSGNKVPAKTDLDAAEAALQRARASLATAKAQVSQAQATLNQNETNLSKLIIRSPIDGIVLSRAIEPGQTVQAAFQGVTLFTLAEDLSTMELHVDVDEADVGEVKENQEATFTVDGYPDRTFKAHITQVRYGAKTVSGVVTYETVLDVDNKDLLLRPGMTATADIVVSKLEKAMLIDNAALRYTPSEKDLITYSGRKEGFFKKIFSGSSRPKTEDKTAESKDKKSKQVWELRNNILVHNTITTGLTDGISTQVTSGDLKIGTQVITGIESETK
jgi:HlyD family secretion protein